MAKPTSPRHSKTKKPPVTIDLSARDVKQVKPVPDAKETKVAASIPAAEPVGDFDNPRPAGAKTAEKPIKSSAGNVGETNKDSAATVKPEGTGAAPINSMGHSSGNNSEKKMNATPPPVNHGKTKRSSGLGAGVSGGVIALAGAATLYWLGFLPLPAQEEAISHVAELEHTVQKLQGQVAQTEETLAGLRNSVAVNSNGNLLERVEKAEREIQQSTQAAQQTSQIIAALEKQVAASPAGTADQASIDQLTQRIADLEQALSKAQAQAQVATAAAATDKAALEDVARQLSSLQERLSEQARQPDMAAIVAANALKSAVDRGGSYEGELQTYLALNTQPSEQIESLQALSLTGIPTYAQLVSRFPAIADEMIRIENQPPSDAGFWDQLLASAKSMIRARPVGNVEGADTGAITARIEVALKAEQPESALNEWQNLPANVQREGRDFYQALVARHNADSLLTTIIAQSLQPGSQGLPAGSTVSAPENSAATPDTE